MTLKSHQTNPLFDRMMFGLATCRFLSVLLAIACTECFGQGNIRSRADLRAAAIGANNKLRSATIEANAFSHSLQIAMAADLRAHQETRATLRSVVTEWEKGGIASARLPLIEARAAAVSNIQANLSSTLKTWQDARRDSNVELNVKLSQHLAVLEESAKALKEAAKDSARRATVVTNDLELALAAAKADRAHLANAAHNMAAELNARVELINSINQWDAEETRLTAQLFKIAKMQQQKIQTAYEAAVEYVKKVEPPKFNPGSEPLDNAALLDGLIKYTSTVKRTSEAVSDYLESGTDHFPHSVLNVFDEEFFSVMPTVASGEGATLQEVKNSQRDLQSVQVQFEETSQIAVASARNIMKEALDEALVSTKGFAKDALDSKAEAPSVKR
jgi:hypothetical protein